MREPGHPGCDIQYAKFKTSIESVSVPRVAQPQNTSVACYLHPPHDPCLPTRHLNFSPRLGSSIQNQKSNAAKRTASPVIKAGSCFRSVFYGRKLPAEISVLSQLASATIEVSNSDADVYFLLYILLPSPNSGH